MKPVHINFVVSNRWRGVWVTATLLGIAVFGVATWYGWEIQLANQKLRDQIGEVQRQTLPFQPHQKTSANPKYEALLQVSKVLERDLNPGFAAVEGIMEEGVRLRSMSIDAIGGSLRLEYEVDAMARVATVTALLNAGYDTRPWHLEGVSNLASTSPTGFGNSSPVLRAVWVVQMENL